MAATAAGVVSPAQRLLLQKSPKINRLLPFRTPTGENLTMPSPLEFARSQQARFLEELKSLIRIPSISTLPDHAGDVRLAAESLAKELARETPEGPLRA